MQCYKDHGSTCTEGFYREQVIGELRNERPDDDAREQVAALLAQDAQARAEDAELLDPNGGSRSADRLEAAAALLDSADLSDDERVAQVRPGDRPAARLLAAPPQGPPPPGADRPPHRRRRWLR